LEGLNVEFMAHDFFDEQPVKGAEVYYYRHTLHNWPDKYCTKTLKALIPALKTGARLLIMDMLMPPPGALPNDLDRKLRYVYAALHASVLLTKDSQGHGSNYVGNWKCQRARSE